MQNVARLANTVLHPAIYLLLVVQVFQINSALGTDRLRRRRTHPDDPDTTPWRALRSLDQQRREQLREQEGRDIVRSELQLVALFRLRAGRSVHYGCIILEDVKSRLLGQELLRRRLDGAEVFEVEVQIHQFALGGRDIGFDLRGDFLRFRLGARGKVDFCIGGVEDLGEFFPDAACGPSYYEDLLVQIVSQL